PLGRPVVAPRPDALRTVRHPPAVSSSRTHGGWPGGSENAPGLSRRLREPPPGTAAVRLRLVGRASRLRDQSPALFAENPLWDNKCKGSWRSWLTARPTSAPRARSWKTGNAVDRGNLRTVFRRPPDVSHSSPSSSSTEYPAARKASRERHWSATSGRIAARYQGWM